MITFPNAKINIGLDILGKRADGYHDIETIMIPVPWCDILEIVPSRGTETTLTVSGRHVDCPPEKNLVMKAYIAMNEFTPLPPLNIYLHKAIPDGAGLGGGSADAAFTIAAIAEMLRLDIDKPTLAAIAATVGADCPFFIHNCPMLASGTGTVLNPVELDLTDYNIIIVKPPVAVPTKEAYAEVIPAIPDMPLIKRIASGIDNWQNEVTNGFESGIVKKHPEIGEIKSRLLKCGAKYAAMTGSGSAVFAIYKGDIMTAIAEELSSHNSVFNGKLMVQ